MKVVTQVKILLPTSNILDNTVVLSSAVDDKVSLVTTFTRISSTKWMIKEIDQSTTVAIVPHEEKKFKANILKVSQ